MRIGDLLREDQRRREAGGNWISAEVLFEAPSVTGTVPVGRTCVDCGASLAPAEVRARVYERCRRCAQKETRGAVNPGRFGQPRRAGG